LFYYSIKSFTERVNMDEILKLAQSFYIPREIPVFLLKRLLNAIYKIEITGEENIPKQGGAVLVCNHTDALDPPIQGVFLPRKIVFLAKNELFSPQEEILKLLSQENSPLNSPALSFLKAAIEDALNTAADLYSGQLKHWGGMPVVRNYHGNDAKAAVAYYDELEEYIANILRSGEIVSIFPEGTRTTTGVMGPFKALAAKLAIRANVPIIPSGISGAWNMSSPQAFLSGAAFKTKIVYNIGNPITPDQFPRDNEKKSAKMLNEEIEKRVYYLTTHWERRGRSRRFATVL
ncbi:MAG TPA: lysophospholipid acyltransferase family protein, partial [Leptospiraceae bacterium]|nr:lysophospholipid acyltransferase family protein [Leptospiraceae bacterium]